MAKIYLFVSRNCPHCPRAASVLLKVIRHYEDYNLSYNKLRVKTEMGKTLSIRYGINAFPTALFFNEEDQLVSRISGVPSEETVKRKIDKLLGLNKSFFDRLFRK